MLETPEKTTPSVTLEQLLQLKRSEKPAPAFWEEFDRELRRRQLASLVSVRPWHERFIHGSLIFLKRAAPVGAAAVALTAGIVSVNRPEKDSARPVYTAGSQSDARFVLLPEEHIAAPKASSRVTELKTERVDLDSASRYAVKEFGFVGSGSRSFSTISAPLTFSAPPDVSNVYMVKTLTATPFGGSGLAEPTSF